MRLTKISIKNFKSFLERQDIFLQPGFNIFLGKNNSGKTTAFEILKLPHLVNDPHKSEKNIKEFGDRNTEKSYYEVEMQIDLKNLTRAFGESLLIPIPDHILNSDQLPALKSEIESNNLHITFSCSQIINSSFSTRLGKSNPAEASQSQPVIIMQAGSNEIPGSHTGSPNTTNPESYRNLIYTFSALRTPNSTCQLENEIKLRPDASNIAFCINHLQTKDAEGHKQLCSLLNRIFPEVKWIQAPPIQNNQVELECLATHSENRRSDLAVPLKKMGTGIGNVIAILYILLTSRTSQVIAIDEPNSFLHPKALRELLQILETYGKEHQYILTGHSPEVLTSIEPATITYFEIENHSTKIKQFSKHQYHEFRSELSDLGIRMTDLHAKDRVLWVEGSTEEIVLPMLLRKFCPEISAGTAVLRVTHTGTFESKKVPITEVAQTYERLTTTSLAPPMMAIILDKELRKEAEIQTIERASNNKLRFLPYRMIENYVLSAPAIQAVLKNNCIETNIADIENLLLATPLDGTRDDGANILKGIFYQLSGATLEFRKTTHTPELFEWILENNEEALSDLKKFILDVCKQDN